MRSYTFKTTIVALITLSSFTSIQSNAAELDLSFISESALTRFSDSDWERLRTTAVEALDNSPDGSNHFWRNIETGRSGTITIISTSEQKDTLCRKAKFVNTAEEITSSTAAILCKKDDEWQVEERRDTTTSDNTPLVAPSNPSAMYEAPMGTSSDITQKSLGETSEYCRDLSKKIEDLKGNPQRRSVARDLYRTECQKIPRSSPGPATEFGQ